MGILAICLLLAMVTLRYVPAVGAAARSSARTSERCRAPRLTGATLQAARQRAAHAGCALKLLGAEPEQAWVQTVARQSPAPGRRSSRVTIWLNPVCGEETEAPPKISEPALKPGPTELVSGFYFAGGPPDVFSAPHCRRPAQRPGAGTLEVLDASGVVVAMATVTRGHLAEIPLPPGSYSARGTFLDAEVNGSHPVRTNSVVIPAGHMVRGLHPQHLLAAGRR